MNYRGVIDRYALNTLIKLPQIPDFHLMVGSAENLDGIPLLVQKNSAVPQAVAENIQEQSKSTNDELQQKIADNVIELDDLNFNVATIGDSLGV